MTFEPRAGCTVGTDGRITFDLPLAAQGQQLLLRLRPAKGQPERVHHVLDLEPAERDRVQAILRAQPVLEEGRWDVFLLRDSGRQRLKPGLRDLRALVDSRLRTPELPLAVRIPYTTTDGRLAIRAWLRSSHAEADRIEVTDCSLTVGARLHGASIHPGASVRLRLRGSHTVRTVAPQAEKDDAEFSFTVQYADLVSATGADGGVWDIFVQPAPNGHLIRVARLLDDVPDRKEVFVYPSVPVEGAELRPYYTIANDLSVDVRAQPLQSETPSAYRSRD